MSFEKRLIIAVGIASFLSCVYLLFLQMFLGDILNFVFKILGFQD